MWLLFLCGIGWWFRVFWAHRKLRIQWLFSTDKEYFILHSEEQSVEKRRSVYFINSHYCMYL
jgi:hypothetical protein